MSYVFPLDAAHTEVYIVCYTIHKLCVYNTSTDGRTGALCKSGHVNPSTCTGFHWLNQSKFT